MCVFQFQFKFAPKSNERELASVAGQDTVWEALDTITGKYDDDSLLGYIAV
jgi:hypothetical protein